MGRAKLNQRGQMTVEFILILVVLFGIAVAISRTMRSQQVMANLVEGPWLVVQGMIEDGVWMRAGASKAYHPNHINRHGTQEGDPP